MYDSNYGSYRHKLLAETALEAAIQKHDARTQALHIKQIKEVYRNSSKIADLVYIQGYGEFLLDKNDNLIKVQKEQDNEL